MVIIGNVVFDDRNGAQGPELRGQIALETVAQLPEEPPELAVGFHGFFVWPRNQLSPCASAPSESFATSTAPASRRRSTTVASKLNT